MPFSSPLLPVCFTVAAESRETQKGRDRDVTQIDGRMCWDLFYPFLFITGNLAFNPLG